MSDAVQTGAHPILKSVQEMLNEEKWTRATISNYSTGQFKELDLILKDAGEAKLYDELKNLCDEHLVHTKNSIIALYFSGMIALSRQLIDDAVLVNLVTIFVDNHKWGIVRYLCERILDYGESKFALRTLAECCKNENDEEQMLGIWQRLVKADFEEADIAKSLAEHYEKLSDIETAVDYYKKALHRYISKQLFTNVREIWAKLLEYCPDDIDLFFHVEKRVAKNVSEDKSVLLLEDVYASCKKRGDIDTAILILKMILQYDERDSFARREIAECFRIKYKDHSQLEECVRVSNLTQNWRNVREAITDFEKHIAFDKGSFVFHRTWGVGRIASIQGDEIVVDFAKKRAHSMSLKMAVNALQTLAKNHIWVLKAMLKKEKLHERVKNEHAWALQTIIKSFGNSCDIKRIKAELVPSVLSAGEWSVWNARAREILKSDPGFGVSPDNIDLFTVRDRIISIEEKLYKEFRAEKNFFDRIVTIRSYAAKKETELESEYFNEMYEYFSKYLKPGSQINENVIASYLLIKELSAGHPNLDKGLPAFNELFEYIDDIPQLFQNIRDAALREAFLKEIRRFVLSWPDIYIKLFPHALLPSIITSLEKEEGCGDKLAAMVQNSFENYRENREAAVWLYKNSRQAEWFARAGIGQERIIIVFIYILDITYRDIDNHRNTTDNRKINKQVYALLFKDGLLESFIKNADEDTILRVYTLIDDVKDLDPADKLALRSLIQDAHPELKLAGETEKKASRGLIVTAAMFGEKQRQLAHIMDVEVPANSKEIGFALSLGDLRENAEYKAAKEKQEILNSTAAKLKDEIERAQIFDPASVNADKAGFGTSVILVNGVSGAEEEYTILGPWESDPENRIISYLSPFGSAILNKKTGESFTFSRADEKLSYTVKEITKKAL